MNEKLFWWGPEDPTGNEPSTLWYTDSQGFARSDNNPNDKIRYLMTEGYTEISWRTAQAMGAPF